MRRLHNQDFCSFEVAASCAKLRESLTNTGGGLFLLFYLVLTALLFCIGMGGGGMVRRGAVASPYRQPLGQLLPATNTMENNQMGTGYFLPYTPPPPPKMADQSPPQSLSPASSDASLLYMCREIWGMDSSFLQSSV